MRGSTPETSTPLDPSHAHSASNSACVAAAAAPEASTAAAAHGTPRRRLADVDVEEAAAIAIFLPPPLTREATEPAARPAAAAPAVVIVVARKAADIARGEGWARVLVCVLSACLKSTVDRRDNKPLALSSSSPLLPPAHAQAARTSKKQSLAPKKS
jgi:hypothetical protein